MRSDSVPVAPSMPKAMLVLGTRAAIERTAIVGVIDERRCRRKLQRVGDDVLGAIDLAIAIQLVAEQVEQNKSTSA